MAMRGFQIPQAFFVTAFDFEPTVPNGWKAQPDDGLIQGLCHQRILYLVEYVEKTSSYSYLLYD